MVALRSALLLALLLLAPAHARNEQRMLREPLIAQIASTLDEACEPYTVRRLSALSDAALVDVHDTLAELAARASMIAQLVGTTARSGGVTRARTRADLVELGDAELRHMFDIMERECERAAVNQRHAEHRRKLIAQLAGTPSELSHDATLSLLQLRSMTDDELIAAHSDIGFAAWREGAIAQLSGTRSHLCSMGTAELAHRLHTLVEQNAKIAARLRAEAQFAPAAATSGTQRLAETNIAVLLVEDGEHARCLDRHHMTIPLQHPVLAQRARRVWRRQAHEAFASPPFIDEERMRHWTCVRWSFRASGAVVAVDLLSPRDRRDSCLTRFGIGDGAPVKAMPCEAPLPESQRWTVVDASVEGTITIKAKGLCVVPVPVCGGVGQAARLGRCAPPHAWRVELMRATGARSALPPDCAATHRAPALKMRADARAAASVAGKASALWERTHSNYYRDFRDAFHPVPLSYLEWLAQLHGAAKHTPSDGLSKADWRRYRKVSRAIHAQFAVRETSKNFSLAPGGTRPRRMISLSLFAPMPISNNAQVVGFGHRIAIDNLYAAVAKHAPRTLAEAMVKLEGVFGGKGFYARYCQPLVSGVEWVAKHMNSDGDIAGAWGTIVHLSPVLSWMAPILLRTGNCEVRMMATPSMRTAGALWRWLPFDDTTLDVVLSFDADDMNGGTPLQEPLWSAIARFMEPRHDSQALLRQFHGASARNSAIPCDECPGKPNETMTTLHGKWLCYNHATILANYVCAKPRQLTRSFKTMLVGFSLHRALLAAEAHDNGLWKGAKSRTADAWDMYSQEVEDPRLFPASYEPDTVPPIGVHKLGWGRQLFDYGFDEAVLKYGAFYESAMSGALMTVMPPGRDVPFRRLSDGLGRRCSNMAFLDLLFTIKPAGISVPATSPRANKIVDVQGGAILDRLRTYNERVELRTTPCAHDAPLPSRVVENCRGGVWCRTEAATVDRWIGHPNVNHCLPAITPGMTHGVNSSFCVTRNRNTTRLTASMCRGACTASARTTHCRKPGDPSCAANQWSIHTRTRHLVSMIGAGPLACITSDGDGAGEVKLLKCLASFEVLSWTQRWTKDTASGSLAVHRPDGSAYCLVAKIRTPASMVDATGLNSQCAAGAAPF